jgi:hypothetical protein
MVMGNNMTSENTNSSNTNINDTNDLDNINADQFSSLLENMDLGDPEQAGAAQALLETMLTGNTNNNTTVNNNTNIINTTNVSNTSNTVPTNVTTATNSPTDRAALEQLAASVQAEFTGRVPCTIAGPVAAYSLAGDCARDLVLEAASYTEALALLNQFRIQRCADNGGVECENIKTTTTTTTTKTTTATTTTKAAATSSQEPPIGRYRNHAPIPPPQTRTGP